MSDPFDTTFEFLKAATNRHALAVLVAGSKASDSFVRDRSAAALLQRSERHGHLEVIRRWGELSEEFRESFDPRQTRIADALRSALAHEDDALRFNALEIVRRTEAFEFFPTLLQLTENSDSRTAAIAAELVRDLAERLDRHCHPGRGLAAEGEYLRNAPRIRHLFLSALDQAATRFDELRQPEVVVEAILMLGDPEHFAVRKVLWQGTTACREMAGEMLSTSRRTGIMRLILDSLETNYPHTRVFEILSTRDDGEFLDFLLRTLPKQLSTIQQKNLAQVESLAWLSRFGVIVDELAPELQPALVAFISALGIPFEAKLAAQEWLVRNGSFEGRLATADVLGNLDDSAVQQIVHEGLACDDPDVQAWATGQLRSLGGPEAFSLLIERLDSPLDQVRAAARDELHSFDLDRVLELHEQLSEETCRRAGRLLLKIDPDAVVRLRAELMGPVRHRRIRVAKAAQKMKLHELIVESLAWMLEDEDAVIRRTAVEILETIPSLEVDEMLKRTAHDSSSRVREAATHALERRASKNIVDSANTESSTETRERRSKR